MSLSPARRPVEALTAGSGREAVDRVLRDSTVLLVVGPGGVGKTTLAAALAVRAVDRHQRRVLVVTVDPARRLAEALGIEELPAEPVLVPVDGAGEGRLFALMVDMSRSWDELVRRHGPGGEVTAALLANPLYRSLTTRFIHSHDYIALDLMCDLAADDRYDLVVIDTPPAAHALDVLDAPDRMVEFFDSRLLRLLISPYQTRLARVTARPFLAVAERLLGQGFLAGIAEFFWLFAQLRPGLVARARQVRRRLDDPATTYALVTTAEPAAAAASRLLAHELRARHHDPALVLNNRALPALAAADLAAIGDPALARAVTTLLRQRPTGPVVDRPPTAGQRDDIPGVGGPVVDRPPTAGQRDDIPGVGLQDIGWRAAPVNTLAQLRTLLD